MFDFREAFKDKYDTREIRDYAKLQADDMIETVSGNRYLVDAIYIGKHGERTVMVMLPDTLQPYPAPFNRDVFKTAYRAVKPILPVYPTDISGDAETLVRMVKRPVVRPKGRKNKPTDSQDK